MANRPRPSRALREKLYARSGGICEREGCETPITLETLHVSHIRAHSHGGTLHESNVAAWCSRCNLTLGARDAGDPRLEPREWQLEALDRIVARIASDGAATLSAAPGSGKTVFAGLVFETLYEADLIDRMVVLVPRRGLVDQWANALNGARHIELKPHSATERPGQLGVVVTYQSLQNPDAVDTHRMQASRARTLLVLDEVHHVGERTDGRVPAWAQNVTAFAGDLDGLHVTGVLNLSGTLWRSDQRERISTVRYRTVEKGKLESLVDYEVGAERLVGAGELRPIDVYRLGTRARVADYASLEMIEGNLADIDEKPARAVMATLAQKEGWRESFVSAVLGRVEQAHRDLDYYQAKALIVAARQEDARALQLEVDKQMRARGLRPLAALAISDDPDAQLTLEHFRKQPHPGVLCTVDMAGEGYDCPDIAVVGYASNKLTALYVRQVVARAMRVTDRERELGFIIPAAIVVPDAPALVEKLMSYLAPFTHEVLQPDNEDLFIDRRVREAEERGVQLFRYDVQDASSTGDDKVSVAYADGSSEHVDALIANRYAAELERLGVPGVFSPRALVAHQRTIGDLLVERPFDERLADAAATPPAPEPTSIEEQSAMLARQLDRLGGWWHHNGDSPVANFHYEANQAGGIPGGTRGQATPAQLERSLNWMIETIVAYCSRTGKQPPRFTGRRVRG
jgi:superfamily II DNA or RNA helicase